MDVTAMGAAAPRDTPREVPRDVPRGLAVIGIGEVLARLRPEFPDVTISKLRFLEAEGLVEPWRAPSGYRKYTAEHLEQLRYILTAQRDRYLPLRVIREQLGAVQRGERVLGLPASAALIPPAAPHGPTPSSVPRQPAREMAREVTDTRLTRPQLIERSGLDEAGLADLERYGLLPMPADGYYGAEALTIARIAAQLAEYGLEARHLRPYRATADREVGLLAQLVPPLSHQASRGHRAGSGPAGRQQALETVHELAALCAQLHGALVRQGLRDVLGP
jgi:DNA-binding transcriptional MerR regulator